MTTSGPDTDLAIGAENLGRSTVWRAVVDYSDTGNQWIAQIPGINSGAGLFVVAAIAFLGLRSPPRNWRVPPWSRSDRFTSPRPPNCRSAR